MSGDDWWTDVFNADSNVAQAIIRDLAWDHGVKLIALDFDLTIVNINTGGNWTKSPEHLARHVRPCFRELIGAALKNGGVRISVVTFSVQPSLIAQMFKYLYPNRNTDNIIIEGSKKRIYPQLSPEVYRVGKQKHIKKVIKSLFDQYGIVINPRQVVLFDDRSRYVQIAKDNGHLAFEVNRDITLEDIRKFVNNLSKPDTSSDPKIQPHPTSRMVSVLSITSWPPKPLEKVTDGWTGPLNVANIGEERNADENDDVGSGNGDSVLQKKDPDDGMKLGTSVVTIRYG